MSKYLSARVMCGDCGTNPTYCRPDAGYMWVGTDSIHGWEDNWYPLCLDCAESGRYTFYRMIEAPTRGATVVLIPTK